MATQVCEWRRPFSLLQVYFVSLLVLFKRSFVSLFILLFLFVFFIWFFNFYFLFLVTRTKIRNRKAVFQADGPVKGSESLHGRVGVIVSVRSVSLCASCVIVRALFCFVLLFLTSFWFCFLFFNARAKKINLCTWGKQQQLFFN